MASRPDDDTSQSAKRIAKINVEIVGRNAALPDTYGLSPDDLGHLMMARALA